MEITFAGGRVVRVKSLSWDDVEWHSRLESEGAGDMAARRALVRETLERLYGEELFSEAAASNADVLALYNATLRHSYGIGQEDQEKNC